MPELSAADLAEIEALAQRKVGEHCRGALLALVGEVRRLRASGFPIAAGGDKHPVGPR